MKTIDKAYCMSSFLTFRYVADKNKIFGEKIDHKEFDLIPDEEKIACRTAEDIGEQIRIQLNDIDSNRAALLLSGGIDSGILASYMPEGSIAYTVNSPAKVAQIEIDRAKKVCERYGLQHRVVEVTWDDYDKCIDILMRHDGCPVFANEPQVYALAKKIKEDGFDTIVMGDSADMAFGGMDRLLSHDWKFEEWVERFTFVDPVKVLKSPKSVIDIYEKYKVGIDGINYIKFLDEIFTYSSSGAYINAFNSLGLSYIDPYACLKMADQLDLNRVRSGDSKYLLRELYRLRFPEFEVPEKIAMARAVDTWMADWKGPVREEFIPNCIDGMSGEQKFMIYSLERFLNLMKL